MNLIQQLVKQGILEKSRATALDYEVKNSGLREEEVILSKNVVSEDFLFDLKSKLLKMPLKFVPSDEVSLQVLETIQEESARYYHMIPIAKEENNLEVGMVYPEDIKAREALDFLSRQNKFSYRVTLITLSNFEEIFKKYRTLRKEVTRALEELESELKEKKVEAQAPNADIEKIKEDAPISKVVANILRHAIDGNASDVHIEPGRDKIRVRYRLDGVLHSSLFLEKKYLASIIARIKILANLRIDETRVPQDGRFSTGIDNRAIDFRISTFPTTLGEKVASGFWILRRGRLISRHWALRAEISRL
jgi:type IV pilus assembly protein PilB